MAKFDPYGYLQQGMAKFTPPGGFGIPNLQALQELLKSQSAAGYRSAVGSDTENLQRMGMGRSVAGAFSPGVRQSQFTEKLMEALMQLQTQHAQLGTSQRMQLLQSLMPAMQVGYQEANKPSWLSSLFGGLLGTGAEMAMPWLGGKVFGNPEMDMLQKIFGVTE